VTRSQFSPSTQLSPIERLRCPNCTSRMTLERVNPGPIGFEHRLFECPKCDFIQNEVIASDPMKSASAGWLLGELKSPG
jgi:Zn finger protein HypA/HybF involved in hydrogenase expression